MTNDRMKISSEEQHIILSDGRLKYQPLSCSYCLKNFYMHNGYGHGFFAFVGVICPDCRELNNSNVKSGKGNLKRLRR